jgi:denticleless
MYLNHVLADWRAHNNAIFDLAWVDGVNKLLTAAGDQFIVLWDVPTGKKINSFLCKKNTLF